MAKKILSVLLAVCLILTLTAMLIPMPALASMRINNVMEAMDGIDYVENSTIYFGAYPQSASGDGGYNIDPIRWRVLDSNCYYARVNSLTAEEFTAATYYIFDAETQAFIVAAAYDAEANYYEQRQSRLLLTDLGLESMPYDFSQVHVSWESSTVRSWLNGYNVADENGANAANPYGSSFCNIAFSSREQAGIAETALSNSVQDQIYFLSAGEVDDANDFYADEDRMLWKTDYTANILDDGHDTAGWWLRSDILGSIPDTSVDLASYLGSLTADNANNGAFAVRPALHMDLDRVLFSTSADFDNSSSFARMAEYTGTEWKLTLLDGNNGFDAEVQSTTADLGESVTVNVTSLGDGEFYTQISAMLVGDNVKAYGRIGTASTGEVSFDLPTDIAAGDYTLRLFAEDVGGPQATSFASNTVDVSLTVTDVNDIYPVGTRVKLSDNSIWIVLEDAGSEATRFTLVRDGFLSGTFTRAAADTALSDYQTTASTTFDDPGAETRLPSLDEMEGLEDINSFSDQTTQYWLADSETSNEYLVGYGHIPFLWLNRDYYAADNTGEFAVRPVLTISKSALVAFAPNITQQPQDADFEPLSLAGDDAEFSLAAAGINLAYQWQVQDGEGWTDISGAEDATLIIEAENENYAEGKTFRCQIDSDWDESIYSDVVHLITFNWEQYGRAFASAGADYTVSEDGGTVTLHTAAGLGWLAAQVNSCSDDFAGKTVMLDNDIDLAGRTFEPIGGGDYFEKFRGHFDGGMHAISGLTVCSDYRSGLFGYAEDALIENLLIMDGSVTISADSENTNYCIGALCAVAIDTTIRNVGIGPVTVSAREADDAYYSIGGIVGFLDSEERIECVYNCYSRAVLTGNENGFEWSIAGGIVGNLNNDTIANCYFAGSIENISSYIGGIAGSSAEGVFSNCFWQQDDNILCGYYDMEAGNTGCTALTAAQMKSADTVAALNAWATTENTTAGSAIYKLWGRTNIVNNGYPVFLDVIPAAPISNGGSSGRTITVTETSSGLFTGAQGAVQATANMRQTFNNSVEVKVTNTDESVASFGLGIGNMVYPFDISLYIKGTNTKTEPKDGYAVTISLPIPEDLLAGKEQLSIAHKADDGSVTTLSCQLKQIKGIWYLVFEATEFSPYALVENNTGAYAGTQGLPYYVNAEGKKICIGFAANGKYLAPCGVTVLFQENPKTFADTGSHWAKDYIGFVTEREIFLGAGGNAFSPDSSMTRAMFATVIGRLYERSFGEIADSGDHAFTDCDYDAYYGKYVDWAAENAILGGYGNSLFGPDDSINREQMAATLYRFAEFLGIPPERTATELAYPDKGIISSWAVNAALYCQRTGIITGREGGCFVPQGTVTRAEVATIIQRFIESALAQV